MIKRDITTAATLAAHLLLALAAGPASAEVPDITDDQRARIVQHVLTERRPSVVAPGQFAVAAGTTLPHGVELFWMSPAVGLNHYRYAVVGGRTLVVAPYTRRIIAVLE